MENNGKKICAWCDQPFTPTPECGCYCPECCDDDYDDGKDQDFYEEQRERELERKASFCECGAWQFSKTGVIHVADCCCGAE